MKWARRATGAVLGVVLAAAAAGFAVDRAVARFHPYLPRDYKMIWIRHAVLPNVHRPHGELLWMTKPSFGLAYPGDRFRWRIKQAPHPVDPSVGYKSDVTAQPPVDIAVIGDSFTYGVEVDQDENWVELFKKRTGLKVVNLAVTSYGTSQEAALYRLYGQSFKPRVVVQVLGHNDPLDNIFFSEKAANRRPDDKNLCWFLKLPQNSTACRWTLRASRTSALADFLIYRLHVAKKRAGFLDVERMTAGTEIMCRDLETVRALTAPKGVKFAAVLVGFWRTPDFKRYTPILRSCLERMKVPYLELDDVAEMRRRKTQWIGRFDGHWTPEGHEYVAGRVQSFLEGLGWPADRKRSSRKKVKSRHARRADSA